MLIQKVKGEKGLTVTRDTKSDVVSTGERERAKEKTFVYKKGEKEKY